MSLRIEPFTDEYVLYLRDESRSTGEADFICFPTCEDDVQEALAFARQRGICVTLQGGRTGLAAGCVPCAANIISSVR